MSFGILLASCTNPRSRQEADCINVPESGIHRLDTMLYSTPVSTEIHPDSLVRTPVLEKKVKAGAPDIIEYTGVQTIQAGDPGEARVLTDLPVFTPGSDSLSVPETFRMWENEENARRENDSIHIIKRVSASRPVPVQAEAPRFKDNAKCDIRFLDIEQGMASSYIWSVLEDRRGLMWMGTARGGLSRFDGSDFLHYTPVEGINDDIILSLAEDSLGNIWFGTYRGGMGKFDGNEFTRYGQDEGFSPYPVNEVLADSKGNIWAGTWGDGVYIIGPGTSKDFPHETVTRFTTDNGLLSNFIITMLEDSQGNIWIGTRDGLCRYNGEAFLHLTKNEGLSHNTVVSVLADNKGEIWIGTVKGLNVLTIQNDEGVEGYVIKKFPVGHPLAKARTESLLQDSKGTLWIGDFGGGVFSWDGTQYRLYDDEIGLSSNFVQSMIFDGHENLWIATAGGGINKLNPTSFYHMYEREVHSVLEDSKGQIWLGTRHDGILKFEGEEYLQYSVKQGLSNPRVYPLMEDSEGNIWAGTFDGGVNVFDGKYFRHISSGEGLKNDFVLSLIEDEEGEILIGTNGGGLARFDGQYLTGITDKDGLYCNFDGTVTPGLPGAYWYCGLGINWSDGRIIRRYTGMEKMVSLEIWSGQVDRNNIAWFATMEEGVLVFIPDQNSQDGSGTFDILNEAGGLLSNTVWSLEEDPQGNIWICTEKGLNILTPVHNDAGEAGDAPGIMPRFRNYKVRSLLREDGLKGLSFSPNSAYIDGQNRMWLGGTKALSVIDLNTFRLPDLPPRLFLSSLEIDQQPVDFRKLQETVECAPESFSNVKFSGVADFFNYPLDLELPYGLNNLSFHFSAVDLAAPHKILYQYRIEGFDKQWSQLTEENVAVYRKLPPGSYTFEVRALGASDSWSETMSYSFLIRPPLYQTTFAYFNYTLLVLLMIYGLVRWRTRKIMKERDELELQVMERTREIEFQKEEIEQQNDHILEANEELTSLNEEISSKNNEIIDSINYAQRIQEALLPPDSYVDELLKENFIFFKPRDIVSGDFYWIKQVNQYIVMAAADCTGHGVPGALMSMLGMSYLNEIVQRREITRANQVLNELRTQVKHSLRQHGHRDESKDGMDMALCVIDTKTMNMQFTGAHNPLYLIRDVEGKPELIEIKADPMPVGYYHAKDKSFVDHDIQLQMGDTFYIFSDGFIDQKGGKENKRYMSKNFKNLLMKIHDQPMFQQKESLDRAFSDWMGDNFQIDDVLIIGVRV